MDRYSNLQGAEQDISSSFNFSDLWASFAFAPAESFVLNHTNMRQGLNRMKNLDIMPLPLGMDIPTLIGNGMEETELDESMLKLKIGRSIGIINATIENPYIVPDVETLWSQPKQEKVKEKSSDGKFYRGFLGARLGNSCSPFAASLNRKISFSSRVVTLMREFSNVRKCSVTDCNRVTPIIMNKDEDITIRMIEYVPQAKNLYASLEMDNFLKKMYFLRLLQQQKDWIHIEIWKDQELPIFHMFLWNKMTNELIVQMRLTAQEYVNVAQTTIAASIGR